MSKIEEKIDKAASLYGEAHVKNALRLNRDATPYDKHHSCFNGYDLEVAFEAGAKWALTHQWRSVEEDGLPKAKDYEYHLMPSIDDDRPTIFVANAFLICVAYNDSGGFDYCEANFKILPDGEFEWLYCDDDIASQTGNFKVTHWMPIPPLPEARKEES